MRGTEKQIKWAAEIKATMKPDFDAIRTQFEGNAIATKAIDFVQGLDWASFWIDNRSSNPMTMMNEIAQGKLRTRGNGYGHTANFDQATGAITVTWTEIISDGKGGHKEEKKEII